MEQSLKMNEMREDERPYEKCLAYGAEHLTDAELLAILLRTGTKGLNALELAHRLLQLADGGESILAIHHLSFQKLQKMKGIGKVKAIQILCLSELARRLAKTSAKEHLVFNNPAAIAKYYMEDMRHQKQEYMKLLMLNTKGGLIGEKIITKGTVNASLISPRELFIEALEYGAVSIILIHNHPSGDPTPSQNDIYVTKQIGEAGKIIGIELLDHIIIGNNCYVSFAEEQLI